MGCHHTDIHVCGVYIARRPTHHNILNELTPGKFFMVMGCGEHFDLWFAALLLTRVGY